jgi:hypothetical protein
MKISTKNTITNKKLQSYCQRNQVASILLTWACFLLLPIHHVSAEIRIENNQSNQAYLPIAQRGITNYYVSPQGSDSNPGTFARPWRTISKAADSVEPNSNVYIRGGTYNEKVVINQSGNRDMRIRFIAYSNETPIIDGEGIPINGGGLISIHGNWVEINGIEVRNSTYWGIGLFGEHDTVKNVFVHHSQRTGIYINGDYGIVQDSRIWRNSIMNEYGNSDEWSSGIATSRDYNDGITDYPIIRHNVVWENWGQGINTHQSDNVTIEDNISHDNYINNIYIHDVTNVLCQRNFSYTDPKSYVFPYGPHNGIMMGDERDTPSKNIYIINNISIGNNWNYVLFEGTNVTNNILIANNTFVNAINSGGVLFKGYHQNIRFENNIVQQDSPLPLILITDNADVSFANNLWSGNDPPPEVISSGDKFGPPHFNQTGDPFSPEWYKITEISPAKDNALSLPEVVEDYFGNLREATPDMGAHEFFLP